MSDNDYQWCGKRNQRIKVAVCIFRKCRHLREKDGNFFCKFVSSGEKKIKIRKEEQK